MTEDKSIPIMRKLKLIEDFLRHNEKPLLAKDVSDAHELLKQLTVALEGMVHVFQSNLNNVDCGPDYEKYQRALNAIHEAKGGY